MLNIDNFTQYFHNLDSRINAAYDTAIRMRDPQDYAKIKGDLEKLFEKNRHYFRPEYQSVHVSFKETPFFIWLIISMCFYRLMDLESLDCQHQEVTWIA